MKVGEEFFYTDDTGNIINVIVVGRPPRAMSKAIRPVKDVEYKTRKSGRGAWSKPKIATLRELRQLIGQ